MRELGPFLAQSLLVASSWERRFYSSSFITILRCERPVSFIFGPSSEILRFTEKLTNLRAARPPRSWFLEHEGEKSSLVEHPQEKGDVTSPGPGERIHPDPANAWTRAAFKACISMCLL